MRIVFNLHDVGLGNNGGSRTLIKCAENLAKLDKDVILYSNLKSKYTWHKPRGIDVLHANKCPKCDIVIATGFNSVENTLKVKASKKFYYIRGFELWKSNEKKLLNSFRQLNCLVNSEWLKNKLENHGIHSEIVYPGLDFDDFYILDGVDRDISLGCLFHKKHKTKRYDHAQKIAEKVDIKMSALNLDIKNPSNKEQNAWYNRILVWISTSELEGLHNPPMEAALSGCAIVATNHAMSGTSDYVNGDTALCYEAGDIDSAANKVKLLLQDESLRSTLNNNMRVLLTNKIGSRISNMKKMISVIMEW